jgi:ABC-type phosphate/phosphonate transport system permease subunit
MERIKKKITAALLIIAFTQKLGLGLFMHACFHEKTPGSTNDPKNPVMHLQKLRCTCIEDAMIPFAGTAASIIISTPVKYFFSYNNPHRVLYSSVKKIYNSLRGPPHIYNFF